MEGIGYFGASAANLLSYLNYKPQLEKLKQRRKKKLTSSIPFHSYIQTQKASNLIYPGASRETEDKGLLVERTTKCKTVN